MNVLMTAYPEPRMFTYAVELIRGLEREGAHVVLAVLDGPLDNEQRAQLRGFRNVEVYESTYRAEWNGADARETHSAGEWLLELERRHEIDVVHLNEFSHGLRPWRTRPVIAVHQRNFDHLSCDIIRGSIAGAGAIVAPSRTVLHELQGRFSNAGTFVAIPFGRSTDVFATRGKEPMVLSVGEYGDGLGNVGALARVAPRISWPVFIIGDAPTYAAAATSFANSHFIGGMSESDASAVIMRASLFAQPVMAPEDGYCIVDAALYGCALVLADVPELREQWDGAATFVRPNDDESLRAALIWLIRDVQARNDLAERARHRASSFTAEKMAAAYLALYIDLALNAAAGLRVDRSASALLHRTA